MRIPITLSRAFGVAASIALLGGCTDSGTSAFAPLRQPGAASQSIVRNHVPVRLPQSVLESIHPGAPYHGKSFAHPTAGTLVYACDYLANACEWFPEGSNTVAGTIGGLTGPQGIAVGAGLNTDVYVANTGASDVLVYPLGSSMLKSTLVDTNAFPVDVAVAKNGTAYVANIFDTSFNAGDIAVFKPGSTTITRRIKDPNFNAVISDTIDEHNDLVVCYATANSTGACDEFPGGRGPGTTIVTGLTFAGGTAFDSAEDLVVTNQIGQIFVYGPDDGALCNTIASTGSALAFDKPQRDLFVANPGADQISEETYSGCTGGGKVEFNYTAGTSGSLAGVAVDPGPRN
jgi:hypothetical protein